MDSAQSQIPILAEARTMLNRERVKMRVRGSRMLKNSYVGLNLRSVSKSISGLVKAVIQSPPLDQADELASQPKEFPVPGFGAVVFESRHAPGFAPSVLQQEFSKFLFVIAGSARLESDGHVFLLGPNSLVHVPSGQRHFYTDVPEDPVTLYAIHYRPSVLSADVSQQLGENGTLHRNLSGANLPLVSRVRSDFQEMLFEQSGRQDGWQLAVISCLGHLAVRTLRLALRHRSSQEPVFRHGQGSAERVAVYAAQLASGFYRQQTLDEAAAATGLSRRRFTALFRQVTDQPWRKYVEKLRLEYARKLLLETDKSVLAVAFEAGFENAASFYRSFRHTLGQTPQAYRKSHEAGAKEKRKLPEM